MKILKIYENSHEDLVEVLENIIIKDNKTINGFEFYQDNMTGAFEWSKDPYYMFYATPYWEHENIIPFDVSNFDGDNLESLFENDIKLPILKNMNDVNKVIKIYYSFINKKTKLLNKRIELKQIIKLTEDFTTKNYNVDLDNIDTISDLSVNRILKEINLKYSQILQAHKYNF
jgi:hypothetical protein